MEYLLVITTTPNYRIAQKICKIILEKSLASCCQILGPMRSSFLWNKKIERTKEYLCFIKTTKRNYQQLETIIKDNHPYQIPEIVALKITTGLKEYLDWLNKPVF